MLFLVLLYLYFGISCAWSLSSELLIFHCNVNVILRLFERYLCLLIQMGVDVFILRVGLEKPAKSFLLFFVLTVLVFETFVCFGISRLSTVPSSVLRSSGRN